MPQSKRDDDRGIILAAALVILTAMGLWQGCQRDRQIREKHRHDENLKAKLQEADVLRK